MRETWRLRVTLKAALVHLLRSGLMVFRKPERKQFVVRPHSLGLPKRLSYDDLEEVIDALENADHK